MSRNDLIKIKQLPIIEERFKEVSAEIEEKIINAVSLPATEENLKTIKQLRAELNKEFGTYEEQRKDVKSKILNPYNQFNDMYEKYIGNLFKNGDKQLKEKVTSVENTQKEEKEQEVRDYFNEYKASHNLDFITYEQANINVTLTASMKSLKEQAKTFIDKILDDIQLINLEEHKEEILVEYKQTLNASKSIITVKNRIQAIEEQKRKTQESSKKEAEPKSLDTIQEETILQAPKIENIEQTKLVIAPFRVKCTMNQLKDLKDYMKNHNIYFEVIKEEE